MHTQVPATWARDLTYRDAMRGLDAPTVSAWNRSTRPGIMHQSYVVRSSVRALAMTTTTHGLTNKQILLGLTSGQVLGMDRALFDPKRHPNPTPEEREEGIIPYKPELPFATNDMLTHTGAVAGLRGTCSNKNE
jgi:hypothetical protein